jgi:uncharacterized protein YbjT (DUF2867 family)
VKVVLADGTFTPRAVSRNPDSDAAKALKAKGIEVVKGDLFDLESLKGAIKGSEAVFGVSLIPLASIIAWFDMPDIHAGHEFLGPFCVPRYA